ncbi:hypothetical protein SDC9_115161 [bioreactor metagenome]|uniref:Uncharacterized protein n=1 Tax=bioreactor metagenome TaxID=1076179 RepID=A0A645BS27_9ZZZZ
MDDAYSSDRNGVAEFCGVWRRSDAAVRLCRLGRGEDVDGDDDRRFPDGCGVAPIHRIEGGRRGRHQIHERRGEPDGGADAR